MSMVINLVEDHNIYLCEGGPVYNGGVQPTPITYLTQWKIVGNSEVHGVGNLTSWKVSGNSIVQDGVIMSCGDLGQDGKYHVKISNGVDVFDIALTEPLRKVNDVADTIEFPSETEGKALVTRKNIFIRKSFGGGYFDSTHTVFFSTPVSNDIVGISYGDKFTISICNKLETRYYAEMRDANMVAMGTYNRSAVFRNYEIEQTADAYNAWLATLGELDLICQLTTPTTELVDVSPIAVSPTDTYTSANVVPFSAFEHTENKEIWSCGEYNPMDGKYHILVQPQGGSIADIALDAPLRKYNDIADTIEFPSETEGNAVVTRNVESKTVSAYNDADGNQVATTLPDDTILHIQNLYDYSGSITKVGTDFVSHSQRETEVKVTNSSAGSYLGFQLPYSSGKQYYCSCQMKNSVSKYNFIYSNGGSSGGTASSNYTKQSILSNTNLTYCRFATNANSGAWVNDDIFFVKDINIFNVDAMFADCTDLKPTSASDFEALFPNLGYIDRTNAAIDIIVKDGKLYKEDETGIEILVPLATPTTELVDAPQIEEADSYSCVISPGAKAVEWSSFETE